MPAPSITSVTAELSNTEQSPGHAHAVMVSTTCRVSALGATFRGNLQHKSQTWDSKPDPGRNPQEGDGILAKLKIKGRLTTKELATYGIAEKPDEPKANGQPEETLDSGAVVSPT